ncbi:DNA cross-link repair 1 protein-like [Argopecten irradians]|uniref:DNA cross-link repair 1 protein-like n=1 Tax=Argopecten irradians TaxID=31199 RepID=UPI00371B1209
MNGTVIRGTPIAVDFWKIRECPATKLFFLTHLHGDHIVGLSSSWKHKIHCSPITGELLTQLYGIEESLIQSLEVGTSHIIDLDNVNQEKMSVTVIDANHCPGSVMFLFEGYFGRILHTGDFRFCPDMIIESNVSLFKNIDVLYLDNTYCSPECVFPTRDSALDEIVSIVNSHPSHSVVIGMRNLGKEDMLAAVALRCKEWISIPARMMQRISLLKLPNVFLVDDNDCRIRVVKFQAVSKKNLELWNRFTPTIAILPTALYQGLSSFGHMTNIFTVQYSDHCSYEELHSFVTQVKPSKIIPIVGANSRGPMGRRDISDRANMECFSHLLNKKNESNIGSNIPESVQNWMYSKSDPCSIGKRRGTEFKKSKKFNLKKSSSLSRGVVFSDSDTEEIGVIETATSTNINGKNKTRKRNCAEMLDSNVNSKPVLHQEQRTSQENNQQPAKENLLDRWLSVADKTNKYGNQNHRYGSLLIKTKCEGRFSRNCLTVKRRISSISKTKTSCNSQQETDGDLAIQEEENGPNVEDGVIVIDDSSSDCTNDSDGKGDANTTIDYCGDDKQEKSIIKDNLETVTISSDSDQNFQEISFDDFDQECSFYATKNNFSLKPMSDSQKKALQTKTCEQSSTLQNEDNLPSTPHDEDNFQKTSYDNCDIKLSVKPTAEAAKCQKETFKTITHEQNSSSQDEEGRQDGISIDDSEEDHSINHVNSSDKSQGISSEVTEQSLSSRSDRLQTCVTHVEPYVTIAEANSSCIHHGGKTQCQNSVLKYQPPVQFKFSVKPIARFQKKTLNSKTNRLESSPQINSKKSLYNVMPLFQGK